MPEQTFEKALEELEKTVAKLEKGGLALSESLSLFEKGVHLARFLRTELEAAEKKVEILLKDEAGKVRAQSFELTEDKEEGGDPEDDSEPDKDGDLPF